MVNQRGPDGRVSRDGPLEIPVPPESATAGMIRTAPDRIFPIPETHSEIVKVPVMRFGYSTLNIMSPVDEELDNMIDRSHPRLYLPS